MLRAAGATIGVEHLDLGARTSPQSPGLARGLEASMIRATLAEADGSIAAAARRIGWSRQKLYRRMRALGLDDEAGQSAGSIGE
jgi:DNA-binding NtrC family response regulator